MSLSRVQVDRTTLPAAMLDNTKVHLRVDFADDDLYITEALGRAMELFTRLTQFDILETTYRWTPVPGAEYNSAQGLAIPVYAAASFTATDGAAAVYTDYELRGVSVDTYSQGYLAFTASQQGVDYPWPYGSTYPLVVTLITGFATLADLPFSLIDIIYRIVAWLYENREMSLMPGVDAQAYANSLITGYWVPRC